MFKKQKLDNYHDNFTLDDYIEGKDKPKAKTELQKFVDYNKEVFGLTKKEKAAMKKMTELMLKESMKITKSASKIFIK